MKICLTTFVQGHFLHDTLRDDLRPALDMIRSTYDRFEIREHTFADCPNMNSLVARSLRWVLWDESFRDYDYLYTIDIDMFYIREPQELMEQHIEHMNYIGSDCVSNFRRINVIRKTPFEMDTVIGSEASIVRVFEIQHRDHTTLNTEYRHINTSFLHHVV